jgi:hypothetical protein
MLSVATAWTTICSMSIIACSTSACVKMDRHSTNARPLLICKCQRAGACSPNQELLNPVGIARDGIVEKPPKCNRSIVKELMEEGRG